MIINTVIKKDPASDWWLVEIKELNLFTQGNSFFDALDMAIDLIRTVAKDDKLPIESVAINDDSVSIALEPNEALNKQIARISSSEE
jgi:predicted RNase H-like HicB family nuclease